MHLILIEDDPLVASGIVAGLRLHGLTVDHVDTASKASAALATSHFDVCVLDLSLPDEDGLTLLERWRAQGHSIPVLVLTARDAVEHRVKGLQSGADDYLLKPFDLDELVARLHALHRRASGRSSDLVIHGALSFSASSGVVHLHGRVVDLSRRELALLRALLKHPGRIVSLEHLHDSLYGFGSEVESNALSVHIHHLRRKLGADVVETVRGQGYRLGPCGVPQLCRCVCACLPSSACPCRCYGQRSPSGCSWTYGINCVARWMSASPHRRAWWLAWSRACRLNKCRSE